MKKQLLLVLFIALWGTFVHAQNFDIPTHDSFSLVLTEGQITTVTFRFQNRFDSFFMEAREEFYNQKSKLLAANNGLMPAELRFYKTFQGWQIRMFSEAEPYNPTIAQEKILVLDGSPKPNYKMVYVDLTTTQLPHYQFILTASDSANMIKLLSVNMSYWRSQLLEMQGKKNSNLVNHFYKIIKLDSIKSYTAVYERKTHFTSRVSFGPSITADGFYLSSNVEFGYVFYDKYRQPTLKAGFYLQSGGGAMLVKDSADWRQSFMSSYGLRLSFLNGKNALWPGFKFGTANIRTGENSTTRYNNFGVCFDNTRLFDYELDFFFKKGKDPIYMLTAKFAF